MHNIASTCDIAIWSAGKFKTSATVDHKLTSVVQAGLTLRAVIIIVYTALGGKCVCTCSPQISGRYARSVHTLIVSCIMIRNKWAMHLERYDLMGTIILSTIV